MESGLRELGLFGIRRPSIGVIAMETRLQATCVCLLLLLLAGGQGTSAQLEGSIAGWGQRIILEPPAFVTVVAADGGWKHSVALGPNGTIVAWGMIRIMSAASLNPTSISLRSRPNGIIHQPSGPTARS
jgi:hypothetical protein